MRQNLRIMLRTPVERMGEVVGNELRLDQCDELVNLEPSILHSLLHEEVLERRMPKR